MESNNKQDRNNQSENITKLYAEDGRRNRERYEHSMSLRKNANAPFEKTPTAPCITAYSRDKSQNVHHPLNQKSDPQD